MHYEKMWLLFKDYHWAFHGLWILATCAILTWAQKIIYHRLHPRLLRTSFVWDDSLLNALQRPLLVLIWLFGLSFIVEAAFHRMGLGFIHEMNTARAVIVIVLVLWFAMRLISNVQHNINQDIAQGKRETDPTTVTALSQVIRITVIVIVLLVGLQTLGISISALLTFGGIGGLAIGFAAKDTLANFLGGLMIFFDRPFSVGDWINSPNQDIEGTVEHIGWRLTKIMTLDKRPMYVPNGTFSTITVRNPSRMTHRRIKASIGLRYQDADKMAIILPKIEAMVRAYPTIDNNQRILAAFDTFDGSSLNFLLYAFTTATDFSEFKKIQEGIFLKIIEIVHANGADFAFPTTTIDVPDSIQQLLLKRSVFHEQH